MGNNPLFILAGNVSDYNRGCEAITRGTIRILRECFDEPRFLIVTAYCNEQEFKQRCLNETDASIIHKKMHRPYKRFDFLWFLFRSIKIVCPKAVKHIIYKDLKRSLNETEAVLSLGGDNYSLDYGKQRARIYADLDDIVVARAKPLLIWGASVGPFDKDPAFEKYMINHLRKVYILARESVTIEYLAEKGLTENVYRVADPAFLMRPVEPKTEDEPQIEEGAVGLNVSPLMGRFTSHGSLEQWKKICADIIRKVAQKTGRKIYLIPHVLGSPANSDYCFMKDALSLIPEQKGQVVLIEPVFNAPETKWIISRMSVFAGARTHSTIASLSCCVPTLSFSYSIKAKGLNKDIFGHTEHCLSSEQLEPGIVAEKIEHLLGESEKIRGYLERRIPEIQDLAMNSGRILRKILQETSGLTGQ